MNCPMCGGFGKIYEHLICNRCNGTGEVEDITNNEWRKTCSAEEFAEFLADIERDAVTYTGGRNFTTKEDDTKYWREWLKDKHEQKKTHEN